jgi:hypothetical protein
MHRPPTHIRTIVRDRQRPAKDHRHPHSIVVSSGRSGRVNVLGLTSVIQTKATLNFVLAEADWPKLSVTVTPKLNVPGVDVSATIAWLVAPVVQEKV